MGNLIKDVRYGVRMLVGKPAFSITAVVVLALGIGANSAIFSLVNAFLLRPLLIQNPDQIVGVFSRNVHKADSYRAFSYPNYVDLREGNAVFSSLAAHNMAMVGLAEGATTRRVFADLVSANYFSTFGVPLYRGRAFTPAEERPGSSADVVIASHGFWKKNGSDPDFIGKTLRVNSRVLTVVGITAEGFTGTQALLSPELYMPLGLHDAMTNDFEGVGRSLAVRSNHVLILIGRLKPELTQKAADSQLAAVASGMEKAYPAENKDQTLIVHSLSRMSISTNPQNDNQVWVSAILLLSMAAVVLLIAALNVANMMLARGSARRKEIAIRLALGGARKTIVRQLFTESFLLALVGGAAGLIVAYWSTTALMRTLPRLIPVDLFYSGTPDVRILAATMGFCLFGALLFGLGPAWNLSRPNLTLNLKDGENEEIASGKRSRLFSRRNVLVMSQVALSLVLLTSAGLFVRSAQRAANVEPGFRLDNGMIVEVDPSMAGYDEARGRQILQTLTERLRGIPGVQSVSLAGTVPFGMVSLGRSVQRSSDAAPSAADPSAKGTVLSMGFNIIGPDYFKTLGVPMLRGRAFTAADTKTPVVILDKTAAQKLWPNQDAVGKHVRMITGEGTKTQDAEVVGVASNIQASIFGGESEARLYVPFGQEYQADMHVHLKTGVQTKEAEAQMLETIRREIRAMDNRLPILTLKTLHEHLDSSAELWIVRTGATLFSLFGSVALILAMVGLYGVRAYTVARRTREIGIRMALGANAMDTLRMILREGLVVTLIGAGVGLALSAALGKVLAGFLYKVSGADPVVFTAAPILLAAISLLACYLPARRAARVDPMVALRYE
ncbi:MAG TPA: ABC transporter permease [Bryobacteraceae bacterium]|nr:ABC transporter permease [Bryobacteraceae bacterium]